MSKEGLEGNSPDLIPNREIIQTKKKGEEGRGKTMRRTQRVMGSEV